MCQVFLACMRLFSVLNSVLTVFTIKSNFAAILSGKALGKGFVECGDLDTTLSTLPVFAIIKVAHSHFTTST